ncbi:MAG: FkbM family methyltransferase [Candidatus Omnitrophica bacterium]|nr:FkbM family methyltransferase [Candidatus Omnitrophota bacterium]
MLNSLSGLIKNVAHEEEAIFALIKSTALPVILWGAGEIAWCVLMYLRQHGIEPVCFCDNDLSKQGMSHIGLPVYSYEGIKNKFISNGGKYQIVVATGIQYKEPIFSQLSRACEKNPFWYLRGFEVCGEKINYPYYLEYESQFNEAYSLLADDFSKSVYANVLNAKISGDFSLYSEIKSKTEYFDDDIVSLLDNEVFLDVGAFKGNAIIEFNRRTNKVYDGIIAFEPDKKTLLTLEGVISLNGIKKIELHNMGAWHKHQIIHFQAGREGGSRISEIIDNSLSADSMEVDTIDNILNGRRVTYVSMDIEGAEHNAILGAEQTIKKWMPKLAVSVYHRREDLFDLLLLLRSFVPGYKFFMRHYTDNQTETVLYAIADKDAITKGKCE